MNHFKGPETDSVVMATKLFVFSFISHLAKDLYQV